MDFAENEAQTTVRELAREILEKEAPAERVREVEGRESWFDEALWARLAEANLLGLAVPEARGGMGFGFLEVCSLLEEVGRRVAPIPVLETLVLGGLPIAEFGSEAQREHWLPKLARGELVLSAALVDAESGEGGAPGTRARAAGAGFVLSGRKRLVAWARQADRILVPASVEGGVGVFLVDPSAPGVGLEAAVTSTGQPLFEVAFADVSLERDALLGDSRTGGASVVRWIYERALVATAALQMGVSDGGLRITASYVGERQQFGVPIGSFQAVQHRCADGYIDLQALRWCAWRAAWRLAEGLPASREAAVAKFWAADAGSRIANSILHLHGGIGSDVDYPIHRYYLWSKALELSLGAATPQLAWLGADMARTGPREGARGGTGEQT
jgi:alkylation response protein AidB-like acyl-CoA dehydrogenase